MSLKHIVFALLTAMAALAAQPLPELNTEAVPGGSVFHVKNTSAQPLTAYLIELVGYPGSSYSLFQDDVVAAIAPGAEKRIPVTNMTVGAAPEYVKITAALFADGSSAGASEKVALIVERRKSMLETTREAIYHIEKAQQAGTAKDALIAQLKQWADSLTSEGKSRRMSQESVSQAAAREAASDAAGFLGQHSIEETLSNLRATEQSLAASKQ